MSYYTYRAPPQKKEAPLPCQTINISLEASALLLTVVLLVSLATRKERTPQWVLLTAATALHVVNTLGDLFSWVLTSDVTLALPSQASNFVTYLAAPLAYTAFILAACGEFGKRKRSCSVACKAIGSAIIVIGLASACLPFVNLTTGILFSIDADNTFTWGQLNLLPDMLVAVQIVLSLPLALERSSKGRKLAGFAAWVSIMALPLIALALEQCWPTLMFIYPAVSLSLLLVYTAMQSNQEHELREKRLELAESQSRMLSSQITSHFMFNSLQAMRELCIQDPTRAASAIETFSDYLRGSLDVAGKGGGLVPLSQEISHVKAYLKLEQIDTAGTFSVEWDLADKTFLLPALTVQPLVENAVRHGIGSSQDGIIVISSWEDAAGHHVSVKDNGKGFTSEKSAGLGIALDNVRTRLNLLCNGTLCLEPGGQGTCATITIPFS